jgi:hypothetical protein
MQAFATFQNKQYVTLGRGGRRRIESRKWNFERGTFIYTVEGAREGARMVRGAGGTGGAHQCG